jgi:hypothetical protein
MLSKKTLRALKKAKDDSSGYDDKIDTDIRNICEACIRYRIKLDELYKLADKMMSLANKQVW